MVWRLDRWGRSLLDLIGTLQEGLIPTFVVRRINRLTSLRDQLGDCIGCGCLSLQSCPMRNPGDICADEGPGPRLLDAG